MCSPFKDFLWGLAFLRRLGQQLVLKFQPEVAIPGRFPAQVADPFHHLFGDQVGKAAHLLLWHLEVKAVFHWVRHCFIVDCRA